MTERIPLARHTKASLDALYDENERLRHAADPELRRQLAAVIEALGRSETELAALRQVARGYCPHCGRGDAAPTVADWEQQRQRADQAETERDTARQSAAAIAAQRDRLRQRMNTLADRWDLEGPPPGNRPLTELRAEISVAPFDPDGAMTVHEYTERGRHLWAFRCWGTDACDGWLGLGHHTQTSALLERERHVAEAHAEPAPAATECETVARVTALYEQWVKAGPPPIGTPMARWWDKRLVELHHAIHPAAEQPARTTPNNPPTSTIGADNPSKEPTQ